jgi:hypothetical protein
MSENYTEPDDDDEADEPSNEDFKNLRAKARKADKVERELAQAKRELAFVKAGIPMDDPKMGYFVKGYEGELDADAIKQAAVEAGFIQASTQQEDPAVTAAKAGQAAVLAASSGTQPQFDEEAVAAQMEQAFKEGGLQGLSDVTQKYGVTFQSTPL